MSDTILIGAFGDIVTDRYIFRVNIVEIEEPCSHPIVYENLCAVCGKDMTELAISTFYCGCVDSS